MGTFADFLKSREQPSAGEYRSAVEGTPYDTREGLCVFCGRDEETHIGGETGHDFALSKSSNGPQVRKEQDARFKTPGYVEALTMQRTNPAVVKQIKDARANKMGVMKAHPFHANFNDILKAIEAEKPEFPRRAYYSPENRKEIHIRCSQCVNQLRHGKTMDVVQKDHDRCHGWYHCGGGCCGSCSTCGGGGVFEEGDMDKAKSMACESCGKPGDPCMTCDKPVCRNQVCLEKHWLTAENVKKSVPMGTRPFARRAMPKQAMAGVRAKSPRYRKSLCACGDTWEEHLTQGLEKSEACPCVKCECADFVKANPYMLTNKQGRSLYHDPGSGSQGRSSQIFSAGGKGESDQYGNVVRYGKRYQNYSSASAGRIFRLKQRSSGPMGKLRQKFANAPKVEEFGAKSLFVYEEEPMEKT